MRILTGGRKTAAHMTAVGMLQGQLTLLLGCSCEQLRSACLAAPPGPAGWLVGQGLAQLAGCVVPAGGSTSSSSSSIPSVASDGDIVFDAAALRRAIQAAGQVPHD